MTNKEFVLTIYPKAYCEKFPSVLINWKFVVFSKSYKFADLWVLGYSNHSSTVAWRSAAKYIQKEMLNRFEGK